MWSGRPGHTVGCSRWRGDCDGSSSRQQLCDDRWNVAAAHELVSSNAGPVSLSASCSSVEFCTCRVDSRQSRRGLVFCFTPWRRRPHSRSVDLLSIQLLVVSLIRCCSSVSRGCFFYTVLRLLCKHFSIWPKKKNTGWPLDWKSWGLAKWSQGKSPGKWGKSEGKP